MNYALVLPLSLILYGALTLYIPIPSAVLSEGAHGPLHALLLKATADAGIAGARWMGLIAGLAGIAAGARMIRSLVGAHAAPGALVLLAASPFLIAHTRGLSPAALALLLVALSYGLFWAFLRSGHPGLLAGWGAASVLAFTADAALIYLPLLQGLILLLYRTRYPQRHAPWWPALTLTCGLWAALFWEPLNRDWTIRLAGITPEQSLFALDAYTSLSTNLLGMDALPGSVLFTLLLVSGLRACTDWRKDARRGLLVGGLCIPCLLYVLLPHNSALLIGALPPLCGLCAMGLRLYPRWARQGLWIGQLGTHCWSYWHFY